MRKTWIYFAAGMICIGIAAWQIIMAQSGLQVINLHTTNPPVTIITPFDAAPASRPTVLIAHGLAGSGVIMRGYALTLAHAGYTVITWDFAGHGTNPNPYLPASRTGDLLRVAESALHEAEKTGLINEKQVVILGHSMGSGASLSFGVMHPDTIATIAISPVPQTVTPALPHNLLLMAGSLEPRFVANAKMILLQAGGEGGTLADGDARKLAVIPNVEHISILFSPTAHATARNWLDGIFGVQPGATSYIDRRILWFSLGILGFTLISAGSLSAIRLRQQSTSSLPPLFLRLVALIIGGLGATFILWLVSRAGVKLSQLFSLLVGGYIIMWFGVAGVIALLILRPRFAKLTSTDLIKGLIAFLAMWLGVGLLGNYVWAPWLLIPARLQLWIPASIIAFPFFLTVGETARHSKGIAQIGWWLAEVIVMVGSIYLSVRINPELGFVLLLLPVFPIMLGIQMLAISPRHGSWAFAFSGALFTSWLILAVFPLQ